MMLDKKARFMLLMYFVTTMVILFFIPMSGNVGPFSFITSIFALNIIKYGKVSLPSQPFVSRYWTGSLLTEKDYPAPALTLAILQLITNIPRDLLPFLPISGLTGFIFYYIISSKVLLKKEMFKNTYKITYYPITLLVITYIMLNRIHAYYVGRATLGVAFFVMIIFLVLRLITSSKKSAWIMLIMVVLITTSFTYYTSILASFFAFLLLSFTCIVKSSPFERRIKKSIFSLTILLLLLVLHQPIVDVLTISPNKFINNFTEWFFAQLKIEKDTEAYYLHVGDIHVDMFTRISAIWLSNILRVFFILLFASYILSELSRKGESNIKDPANVLAIIAIGASLAELFYTFQAPTVSLRFITMISALYVPLMIVKIKNARIRTILGSVISILLIVSHIGTLNKTLLYGRVNDFKNLYAFDTFISCITSHRSIVIAGDSYYTSYAYFKATLNGVGDYFHFTTFHKYVFYLFKLYDDYPTIKQYIRGLAKRGINYLMLVDDGKPITGDPWGYAVMPSYTAINLLICHLDVTYNDGCVYLLYLAST